MGTICTTSITVNNSTFFPHSVFMCFVWIWEQTAIISLYNINWLVFITETECVYCAVRTAELLNLKQFIVVLRPVHTKRTRTKPNESELLSTHIGPNANTVWKMQWLVLPTCSRQLQLSDDITWRCKENEQDDEDMGMAASGLIFLATKIPKERTGLFLRVRSILSNWRISTLTTIL